MTCKALPILPKANSPYHVCVNMHKSFHHLKHPTVGPQQSLPHFNNFVHEAKVEAVHIEGSKLGGGTYPCAKGDRTSHIEVSMLILREDTPNLEYETWWMAPTNPHFVHPWGLGRCYETKPWNEDGIPLTPCNSKFGLNTLHNTLLSSKFLQTRFKVLCPPMEGVVVHAREEILIKWEILGFNFQGCSHVRS